MDLMNRVFSLHLNQLVIIFIDDLFGQPCRAWVFSNYLIYSWVIIQRTVFRALYNYYKFLVMPLRIIGTQHSEFVIIVSFSLFICDQFIGLSLPMVLYILSNRE